jgi:secreted trypsin-like serine protease
MILLEFPGIGDSGAGFVTESHSGSYKIIGIVSAAILSSTEKCNSDGFVVFTNVPLFVDWLLTQIGRADEIR